MDDLQLQSPSACRHSEEFINNPIGTRTLLESKDDARPYHLRFDAVCPLDRNSFAHEFMISPHIRTAPIRQLFLTLTTSLYAISAMAQVNVTTYHNDMGRTGLNCLETVLTPANVNSKSFGLLFSQPVDGQVYAQPLYLSNVNIPGKGIHNVVYVATEHNSVYAFDADSNTGANAQPLWHVNFGPAVPSSDTITALISPEKGITGTPVLIPGTTPVLYVVAFTKTVVKGSNPVYAQSLHALDATTGLERVGSPVAISGSVPGKGDGSVNGVVAFNPLWQLQRAALLYVPMTLNSVGAIKTPPAQSISGTIYVAFGSHADIFPYHGWVFAYDALTLKQIGIFNTGPNSTTDKSGYPICGAGIWQGGSGPASDGNNIFFSTGNGMFNPSIGSYGDSIISLKDRVFTVADYFAPSDQEWLNDYDMDLGAGGVMVLPKEVNATGGPNCLIHAGKEGTVYLMNRSKLGGYGPTDNVLQELPRFIGAVRGAPAYFNGSIYYGTGYNTLVALQIKSGMIKNSGFTSKTSTYFMNTGAVPSVSSNGLSNGIVWAIQGNQKITSTTPAALHAYDAQNLATELYNSNATGGRDTLDQTLHFNVPTVANGKVFVGTATKVAVFGLGKWASTPSIVTPSGTYQRNTTVTLSGFQPNQKVVYTVDGTEPTAFSTRYRGPVTLNSSCTFKARAFSEGLGPSAVVQADYLIDPFIGTGDGLTGRYLAEKPPISSLQPTMRVDPAIDFNWKGEAPIDGMDGQSFTCEWTGFLQAKSTGRYRLSSSLESGVTVSINGKQIFDNSSQLEYPTNEGMVYLVAGQKVPIKVSYTHYGGRDPFQLFWTGPGLPTEVIPTSQLYTGK